jgi:hypothetical protein
MGHEFTLSSGACARIRQVPDASDAAANYGPAMLYRRFGVKNSHRGKFQRGTCVAAALAVIGLAAGCGDPNDDDDPCAPDDADGVIGGAVTFELAVDDEGFSPMILTAQNAAKVTLTLRNDGTTPHSFVIDCIPTPNMNGCPTTSCFPAESSIPPVMPGASAMAVFEVPRVEGIHYFHSDVAGDTPGPCMAGAAGCGQFIVK